jgi:hypothetical protein
MRSILSAIFLLAFIHSQAQSIKIGLAGGLSYNNAPAALKKAIYSYTSKQDLDTKGSYNPLGRIVLAIDFRHIEVGIGAEAGTIKYKYSGTYSAFSTKTTNQSRFVNPLLFINYKHRLPKSYIYTGISGGYFIHSKEKVEAFIYTAKGSFTGTEQYKPKSDISLGVQAGYCLQIIGGLSVNAEAAMRYVNISSTEVAFDVNAHSIIVGSKSTFFYFPFTLGINFKI